MILCFSDDIIIYVPYVQLVKFIYYRAAWNADTVLR